MNTNKQIVSDLQNEIFSVKEHIPSGTFKTIMDNLKKLYDTEENKKELEKVMLETIDNYQKHFNTLTEIVKEKESTIKQLIYINNMLSDNTTSKI